MNYQSGASLVEFAIIIPLLFILFFGIIEFAILMYDRAILTNATREASRLATLYGNTYELTDEENDIYSFYYGAEEIIENKILDFCKENLISFGQDTLEADDIDVIWERTIGFDGDGNPITETFTDYTEALSGDRIVVNVSYSFNFLVLSKLISSLSGNDGIPLNIETVMRIE